MAVILPITGNRRQCSAIHKSKQSDFQHKTASHKSDFWLRKIVQKKNAQ